MAAINPRAVNTHRGQHPDVDPESGDVRPDVELPVEQRDFLRMRQDPVRWNAFMQQVAVRQAREPEDVQVWVAGQSYGGDPYTGYREYQQQLAQAREYFGHDKELTSYDVETMTPEQYDAAFDRSGRTREGYTFRATDRDVLTDTEASMERFSRGEMGQPR